MRCISRHSTYDPVRLIPRDLRASNLKLFAKPSNFESLRNNLNKGGFHDTSYKPNDPYFIDFPKRIKDIQAEMQQQNIDVYLGSRLRTLSWTTDAFCPWRSFIVIPSEGLPTAFTFVIDAARVADDSWLGEDHVMGFAPMGGQDQIEQISEFIKEQLKNGKGRVGIESGMSNYLPEGWLTHYEYKQFEASLVRLRTGQRPYHRGQAGADQGPGDHQPVPGSLPDRGCGP